ncbi:MAG: GAF domain-containing protein [Pirellulales bacterium]|nr:GAF domain-containing protein [Pirellulales bacterium]
MWRACYSAVFRAVIAGEPLAKILAILIEEIECEFPELRCSILLLDEDGEHLRRGAAGRLPAALIDIMDGLKIGPSAGCCGTAIFLNRPVFVQNIHDDPLWADLQNAASLLSMQACWSMPIRDHKDRVVGAFAIYCMENREPKSSEVALLEELAHWSGMMIVQSQILHPIAEHRMVEDALQTGEEPFRILAEQACLAHVARWSTIHESMAGMIHKLNQPLSAISNFAAACRNMLNHANTNPSAIPTSLDCIVEQSHRAAQIAHEILDLTCPGVSGHEEIRLDRLIADAVSSMEFESRRHQAGIHVDLQSDLPTILGDSIQIRQVLLNLIRYACERLTGSEIEPREIQIRARARGTFVEIDVEDNGPEIPLEYLPKLFDPLITNQPEFAGFGPSISKTIIESHRGEIQAENHPGGGAIVRIRLPIASKDAMADLVTNPPTGYDRLS